MKPSEAFQKAIEYGIPQIREKFNDNQGGFCAAGLLSLFDIQWGVISEASFANQIENLNDTYLWTWQNFRDAFAKEGL